MSSREEGQGGQTDGWRLHREHFLKHLPGILMFPVLLNFLVGDSLD